MPPFVKSGAISECIFKNEPIHCPLTFQHQLKSREIWFIFEGLDQTENTLLDYLPYSTI